MPFPSPVRESEVAQSCQTLSKPMDCSLPGSSIHGIFQARVLEWVASAFSVNTSSAAAKSLQSCLTLCDPRDGSPPGSPVLGFSRQEHWSGLPFPSPMRESEVTQSCPTLSDPMDRSLPGSSIHGVLQAGVRSGVPLPSPTT